MTAVISTNQLSVTQDVSETFYNGANHRICLSFGGVVNKAGKMVMLYIRIGVLINGTIFTIVKANGKQASSWSDILTASLRCFFIVLQSVFACIKEKNKRSRKERPGQSCRNVSV